MNSQEVIELVLKGASKEKFFERELEAIGGDIRLAALACAVPLSFDVRLANELFSGPTVGLNGGSARAFKSVTSLPFIHTDLSGGWRFTEEARKFCLNKLKHSNNGDLDSINKELQNYYERKSGLSQSAEDKQKAVSSKFLKAHHTTNIERNRNEGFDEIDNIIYELKDPKIKDQASYFLYQLCERYDSVYDYRKENYYFYEGMRLFNIGRKQEALKKLQPVADSELVNKRVAIACHLSGLILEDRNQKERYFKKSIKIGEQIGDSEHLAHVWHSYGQLLARPGYSERHNEAEECYKKSIKIGEQLDDLDILAQVWHSYGNLLARPEYHERHKEAEDYYEKSIKLEEQIGHLEGQAYVWHSYGQLLARPEYRERHKEAEDHYKKSIKLEEQIGHLEGQAYVWHSYGNLLARPEYSERHEEAETCYNKSLVILKNTDDFKSQIMVLNSFCAFYRERKLYEKAKEKIRESLKILDGFPGDKKNRAICYNELGHIYRALGRFEDAIRNYEIALDAERQEKYKRSIKKYIDETTREKAAIESAKERFSIEGRQALAGLNRKEKLQVMRGIFKGKGIAKDLFEERRRERERDE